MPEFLMFVGESEKKRQSWKRKYQEEVKEAEEALREIGADSSECRMKEGVCIHEEGRYVKQIHHLDHFSTSKKKILSKISFVPHPS